MKFYESTKSNRLMNGFVISYVFVFRSQIFIVIRDFTFMTTFIINLIKFYQKVFSPDHGLFRNIFGYSRCRFYPSCSVYTTEAVSQYGLFYGIMLSLKRIFKCAPWNEGGYDPI